MVSVPGDGSAGANAGQCCQEAMESMDLTAIGAIGPVSEEAGKGSDECIDADAAVGQGNAENQQIAGSSELFDFSERNNCQAIETETKQG